MIFQGYRTMTKIIMSLFHYFNMIVLLNYAKRYFIEYSEHLSYNTTQLNYQ